MLECRVCHKVDDRVVDFQDDEYGVPRHVTCDPADPSMVVPGAIDQIAELANSGAMSALVREQLHRIADMLEWCLPQEVAA